MQNVNEKEQDLDDGVDIRTGRLAEHIQVYKELEETGKLKGQSFIRTIDIKTNTGKIHVGFDSLPAKDVELMEKCKALGLGIDISVSMADD